MRNSQLQRAIRLALDAGALAGDVKSAAPMAALLALGAVSLPALAQDDKAAQGSEKLETIVVTGSRIRRVDLETSSPVVTIDKAAIEKSGKLTVGDLVQEMPAISGAATNTRVNNGGGQGAATVSLRGLNAQRTLILINGKRMAAGSFDGTGPATDINSIPASLIERVEVLKDGASAVYGSDAIGGVINFILRENYQGAELATDYGVSDRDDGERRGVNFTFGHTSDRGSIMGGINYNKYELASSGNRDFSKDATYLYSGVVSKRGSGRNPNGRVNLPANLQAQFGCRQVTKSSGNGSSLSNYRCYSGATDSFNYQRQNLISTPQERASAFIVGNYKLTDGVEVYLNVFHNKTTSRFALAPLPFDASTDGVVISKDNYYNPFGIDFDVNTNYQTRFTGLGQRVGNYTTATSQGLYGFKGNFGDSSWTWDTSFNYSHVGATRSSQGYVFYQGLVGALGPSFRDVDGVVKCGSAGAVIAGCTPLNIFNVNSPEGAAQLAPYVTTPYYNALYILRQGELNLSGELFELPAGAVSLATGASYRKEYSSAGVDFIAVTRGLGGTCFISQEACATPLAGGFTVKELYAELFVPILKDAPFAQSLNFIVGSRYSDYNTSAGNNTSNKFAIEWRPLEDVLVRGTVSEVFRAPNISELYAGTAGSAPIFRDPCIGYTGGHAHACQNVPIGYVGTGLAQTTGVGSGGIAAGIDLSPEKGKSFDFGVVYDPRWIEGLSVNVDVWRIYLNNLITGLAAQTVANVCYAVDDNPFCSYIHRNAGGDVNYVQVPTVNLGRLDTKGVDFGLKYRLPETAIGNFSVTFDSTYIGQFDNNTVPGSPLPTTHVAGKYNVAYGNYARWRALAGVNWNLGSWDANWRIHYVGPLSIGNEDVRQGTSADGGFPGVELRFGAQVEHSLALGYNFDKINTRIDVGVDNVFDKQPPLFYQNNVLNSNTDVNTYDTLGRYYWARVSVKF